MKIRMNEILGLAAAVAVVVALTPGVSANCIPSKSASTFATTSPQNPYVYIIPGGGNLGSDMTYRFWQLDVPANNNGTYTGWLFADGPGVSMNAALGDAGVAGCPAGTLVTLFQTKTAAGSNFVVMTANEGANISSASFDYSFANNFQNYTAIPIPRPRVQNSSRVGTNVNLTINLDSVQAAAKGPAASGLITGFELYRAAGSDPGRDVAGWTLDRPLPSTGGAPVTGIAVTADCSNASVDQFYATRITFAGGQRSDLVSAATRVNCNPALANPKYKIVPNKGPKQTLSPNNN